MEALLADVYGQFSGEFVGKRYEPNVEVCEGFWFVVGDKLSFCIKFKVGSYGGGVMGHNDGTAAGIVLVFRGEMVKVYHAFAHAGNSCRTKGSLAGVADVLSFSGFGTVHDAKHGVILILGDGPAKAHVVSCGAVVIGLSG